jgi:hypothetical protein
VSLTVSTRRDRSERLACFVEASEATEGERSVVASLVRERTGRYVAEETVPRFERHCGWRGVLEPVRVTEPSALLVERR